MWWNIVFYVEQWAGFSWALLSWKGHPRQKGPRWGTRSRPLWWIRILGLISLAWVKRAALWSQPWGQGYNWQACTAQRGQDREVLTSLIKLLPLRPDFRQVENDSWIDVLERVAIYFRCNTFRNNCLWPSHVSFFKFVTWVSWFRQKTKTLCWCQCCCTAEDNVVYSLLGRHYVSHVFGQMYTACVQVMTWRLYPCCQQLRRFSCVIISRFV